VQKLKPKIWSITFNKQRLSNSRNYIVACQISGVFDVNRNEILEADDFDLIQNWYNSIVNLQLNGIIFHNNFSEDTCKKYQNEYVQFIKIEHNHAFKPNVFRYFVYHKFIKENLKNIENLFFTDISDVEVLKNPFLQNEFTKNKEYLFCGDEPEILDNAWMKSHCELLRNSIDDFSIFEEKHQNDVLLNCGIFGGNITVITGFIENLWDIHQKHNFDNNTNFTGDMGAFNYLVRTKYNQKLMNGKPVNTVFKAYDNQNLDCWFCHK
jgi:hypothetical protein